MPNPVQNLYLNEDNLFEWLSMKDASDDSVIPDATVTGKIIDVELGTTIVSGINLAVSSTANGHYQGTVDVGMLSSLVEHRLYYIDVTATSGSRNGFRRIPVRAKYHGSTP